MEKPIDLTGQVAVVTGGGRGIGRAMAIGLAQAGATVGVLSRSADELNETVEKIQAAGSEGGAFVADVTDAGAVEKAVAAVHARWGRVDMLINNAGMGPPISPIAEVDVDAWWQNLNVNLRGPLLMCRAVLPGMIARRRGRVINIASGTGTRAIANVSAYVVSKTALIRLSETIAKEVRDHGLQVFAVHPGTVRTKMAEYAITSETGKKLAPWFGAIFERGEDVPPDEVVPLILQLVAGHADSLTGRFIAIGDDLAEMKSRADEIAEVDHYRLRMTRL